MGNANNREGLKAFQRLAHSRLSEMYERRKNEVRKEIKAEEKKLQNDKTFVAFKKAWEQAKAAKKALEARELEIIETNSAYRGAVQSLETSEKVELRISLSPKMSELDKWETEKRRKISELIDITALTNSDLNGEQLLAKLEEILNG